MWYRCCIYSLLYTLFGLGIVKQCFGALPLSVDVEWVMQGRQFGFQGFFVEYLGFSSAMKELLPQSRITQSSFNKSLDEFPVKDRDAFFGRDLFPLESSNLLSLISKEYTPLSGAHLTPKFLYSAPVVADACSSRPGFEDNYMYVGNNLAKHMVSAATSDIECCETCVSQPLCNAWVFGPSGCLLKGGTVSFIGIPAEGVTSGRIANRELQQYRPPVPRVIVFHGTTCIYNNQSSVKIKRDINTIFIGRFMIERGRFVRGQTVDENAVMSCAAVMDEVWVPTIWHKVVFENIMKEMGFRAPMVAVVAEAVDTTLFDPESVVPLQREVHPHSSDSIFGDGNIAIKEQKECLFVEDTVTCSSGVFEFLSIFKWERRKGWDVLLDAYWNAFSTEDNVVLRIRSYLPTFIKGEVNITRTIELYALQTRDKGLRELAKVIWESGALVEKRSDSLSRADVRDLLASVDAFVLPTRGEGWGLPIAEAMAMALPVIVTNATGPAAYATEENSYLLSVLPELDEFAYVQPDTNHLTKLMRQVVFDSSIEGGYRAQAKGREARATMQSISPHSVVESMIERIKYHLNRRGWDFVRSE